MITSGPETLERARELQRRGRVAEPLGAVPIAKVTREEIERFRDMLDAQIALHKRTQGNEGVGPKTALNIWSVITTTFSAAVASKRRDLRVRADNPCTGVLPPERGESRQKDFVRPVEMAAVLAHVDTPLEWREVYAIGSYLYLRPGELSALTWGDVDLGAAVVHVTKAFEERSRVVKPLKTASGNRVVPIPSALVPLLKRMRGDAPATALVTS